MIGNVPRRRQIFFQQRGRYAERLTRVVESRFIGGIDRKFTGGPDVDPRQVTNRVIELVVAETPGQNRTRVSRVAARFVVTQFADPVDDGPPLVLRRLSGGLF